MALGRLRSMYSSNSAQTATNWTGTALRALLSTPQKPTAQLAWVVGTHLRLVQRSSSSTALSWPPRWTCLQLLQTSTAKHVPATAFDRAAALAERQEGISGSAALEQQQQQQTIQTLCCL